MNTEAVLREIVFHDSTIFEVSHRMEQKKHGIGISLKCCCQFGAENYSTYFLDQLLGFHRLTEKNGQNIIISMLLLLWMIEFFLQ